MLLALKNLKSELQQTGMILGGLLLTLLFFTVVSGIILALFYNTQPEETYRSVLAITENPFTAFIRNFHYWATDLLIFTLFLHITRVALTKPSGKPRRYAWWIGVGLLILVSAEMLIGTVLRADQESLEAYSHFFLGVTGIVAAYIPFISVVADFFSAHTALFRFFIFHVVVIPFSILSLIILHGLFAPTFRALIAPWKKVSDAAIRGELKPRAGALTPSLRKLAWLAGIALFLIALLSLTLPAPFLTEPYAGVEVTKPPWWLLWVYALENIWGLAPLAVAPPILFGIFALIPLLTKDRAGADKGVYLYLITIAVLIVLSFYAAIGEQVPHTEHFVEGAAGEEAPTDNHGSDEHTH